MTRFAVLAVCLAFAASFEARAETLLERGDYLVNSIVACGNCHTPQTPSGPQRGMELAGQFVIETPAFKAYAPNITPDLDTGIGGWSDIQIADAIRNGRHPDGSLLGPPMPFEYYRKMSDRDVAAVVAYLRSVPAVRNEVPRSAYNIALPEAYGPEVVSVREPSRSDPVAYGGYLAGPLGHCLSCHTPLVNGMLDFENQLGAGGQILDGPWGVAVTANITPHEDGIGAYSDADIARAITQGVAADGTRLTPPMGFHYYRNMSADDLSALVAFLRTLEPKPSP